MEYDDEVIQTEFEQAFARQKLIGLKTRAGKLWQAMKAVPRQKAPENYPVHEISLEQFQASIKRLEQFQASIKRPEE